MKRLLAPNGKPSKLNEEQYKLVRTSAFKKWFGDWENDLENSSKVVDEETKEPLVVYHGGSVENTFDELYSVGHYFTSKIEVAKTYSKKIISCFLNIKNPTNWDANCKHWKDVKNEVENLASSLWWVRNKKQSDIVYIRGEEEIKLELNSDGIIIKNIIDIDFNTNEKKWCANTIIVNSSNQIKLADGSNTTFDENNDDIRFNNGGNVLLAPNGKPSKLNEEQYKLVRTPAFKKWFGDWENDPENSSKVVDENGEPKVMYHSSDSEFTIFNPEQKSRWTNQRKEKAIWFGGNNKVSSYTNNGYLYEVFLCSFNPIIVDAKDYDSWNYYYDENNNKTYDIGRIKGRFITQAKEVKWDGTANNNDGILFLNAWDNVPLGVVCVVFESEQIKLADGSNTTFDENNDDIRFNNGGNVLLAPNGKPSKLNEEQYKLVRTSEFKKWFGDWENDTKNSSKVIDEETKEPLVVYHGSFNNFNIFDINKVGKHDLGVAGMGFYFTPNIDTAIDYSKSYKMEELSQELYDMSFSDRAKKITGYVKSFFIDMKNPKYIKYPIDIQIENYRDYKKIYSVTENLINSNYDGVIFKRGDEYGEESDFIDWEYVCFNPNQIKLADGSNTTFDANNDDIRFNDGGEIDLKIISDRKGIIDYLTKNAGRWYQRDLDELNELFNSNIYVEQDNEIVKELSKEYLNFYKKNPNFKKIPLIIYEDKSSKNFGEGELFRYDFLNDAIISSSKKEFNKLKNTKTIPINDICVFVYEKYKNKIYGAFMHEYGHYITLGKVGYIKDDWFNENYNIIANNISVYAGEKRAEFLAEVFTLKNIPNFNEIDKEKKDFTINNYDNLFFERGGRTIAQTPAPKNERIYGSNINKEKSSESNTTFDANNDDIRFETGGSVNKGLFSQIWEWFGIKI